MTADWMDARSAKGPALADFLEGGNALAGIDELARRYVRSWRYPGCRPSFFEVDHVLVLIGMHASQVPESVWLRKAPTEAPTKCVGCGKSLTQGRKHSWRVRYCSAKCVRASAYEEVRAEREAQTKQCANCGKTFSRADTSLGPDAWQMRRYCGVPCAEEARARNRNQRPSVGKRRKQVATA